MRISENMRDYRFAHLTHCDVFVVRHLPIIIIGNYRFAHLTHCDVFIVRLLPKAKQPKR